ncbi:DMT family transporter [Tateyamaria omphalii]|uniref:DMT family transporter n=1 Tax=Tateyamaria omphalii TaxID=299262 RepID=UPI001C99F548|nr:DMT family transporter [Tateyamaria omphalii]MBY5932023.1 DMT family transporter [Tateyamaria omphalii]
MALWIPITVAAAFFQTLRFMLQRQLSLGTLSASGATLARFLYSSPLILVLIVLYMASTAQVWPELEWRFWVFGALGGTAQILATVATVLLFQARNFAVGITFKKTEGIQAVLVGWVLLGDVVSGWGFAAIGLGLVGVLLLSAPPDMAKWGWRDLANRSTGLGLMAGLLFAVSGVCYRGASLSLDLADPLARAGLTLAAVTAMQTVAMLLWLRWREPGQIAAVWSARRVAIWVGLMSMAGSFCWFTAFTLQNAAYVKAVGQVELAMSALASVLIFRETIKLREWMGMAVLLASILLLVTVI